jgi:TPR repeat protein
MSTMSLLPRWRSFGLGRDRADEAVLKERVTALQAALDKCKATARRWTELRLGFVAAIAMVCLALGFVLGLYSGPLKQAAVDLAAAVGLASPPRNADAAFAAYQNGNYAAALQLSRPLADQGDARAQSILGLIYYGGRGVPQDDNEAVKWFRRAADQDDVFGNFYLGVMFADGRGVPQDYAEAAKWYRLAADLGDAQSQYNLGLAYAKGEGVSRDNVSAHMWFNLAAARFPASDLRSRSAAVRNRDLMAGNMTPEQLAEAQKLARDWKPK